MSLYKKKITEHNSDSSKYFEGIRVGNTIFKLLEYKEAMEAFKQAVALDPKDPHPYFDLGIDLINLSKYEEAIGVFKQAVALDPKDPLIYCGLAEAFKSLGKRKEALEAFKQSVPLSKEYIGKEKEAIKDYEQCLALYYKKNIKEKLAELKNYWRFFAGMLIGGFCGVLAGVLEYVVYVDGAYVSRHDIYFWFFIGACGLGLFIGAIFHGSKDAKLKVKKNNRYDYNKEYIIIPNDAHKSFESFQQREATKRFAYKDRGHILYYKDELTPSQIKKIQERDREISEIKERMED